SVKAALSAVAAKAEKKEVLEFSRFIQQRNQRRMEREQNLERQIRLQEELDQVRRQLMVKQQEYKHQEENVLMVYPHAVLLDNAFFETYSNNPQNNHLVSVDLGSQHLSGQNNLFRENYIEVSASKALPLVAPKDDSVRFLLLMDINPLTKQSINNIISLPPRTDQALESKLHQLEKEVK